MMRKYILPTSLILVLSAVTTITDKHSHYFFITITDDSNYDHPSYYTTRSIDDITLYRYDSISEIIERRVPWFRSTYSTLLDASANQFMMQQNLQRLFRIFKNYLNDTQGFHVLQRLLGCIIYDNGTIDTVFSYHYDGRPFLRFFVEKAHWIAEDSRVQYFADLFNQNKTMGEQNKKILLNNCVPHIAELLSLGNCTFNRREKPVVRVTQTPITKFHFQTELPAYGHYPKNISMTWYKNGEPVPENLTDRVTLPFPDITYLTCLTLHITPTNGDVYTCSVEHSSMMLPFKEDWSLSEESAEPLNRGISNGVIIATCLAVILLVVLVVFSSVSLEKRRIQ